MSKLKFNLTGDHKYTFTIQFSGGVDDVFVVVVVFPLFLLLVRLLPWICLQLHIFFSRKQLTLFV